MSKKLLSAALIAAFALPMSCAFAQAHGGGHGGGGAMHMKSSPTMHTNHDEHGDAVSQAAADARASGDKVGTDVRGVANDKNKGKHEAKGHVKNKHGH